MIGSSFFAFAAAAMASICWTAVLPAATLYHVTDLGAVAGATDSLAMAINNSGQIVGYSDMNGGGTHAFLYSAGTLTDLTTATSGALTVATSINSSGQVVGVNGLHDPVLLSGGTATDLTVASSDLFSASIQYTVNYPYPVGFSEPYTAAINSSGQVAGTELDAARYSTASNPVPNPVDLGNLGQIGGNAYAINDSGQVVGESSTASGGVHAFVYSGTSITDLNTLGGAASLAYAINNNGQIVGASQTAGNGTVDAFLYTISSGHMTDLSTLYGGSSEAYGINDHGQIVGTSDGSAFVNNSGTMTDLNNLMDSSGAGWALMAASAINNNGWIVGVGNNPDGNNDAFLLTPVPEPPAGVLALWSLAAIWVVGSRIGRARRPAFAATFDERAATGSQSAVLETVPSHCLEN